MIARKIILAAVFLASPALAQERFVYGVGAETCQVALSHDWFGAFGEAEWIDGYMSAIAETMPTLRMLPGSGEDQSKELIELVHKRCTATPLDFFANATYAMGHALVSAQSKPIKGE